MDGPQSRVSGGGATAIAGGRSGTAIRAAVVLLLWLGGLFDRAHGQTVVDLELVLSVDASGSVDDREYALQVGGIAWAFRDPAVTQAIAGGESKSIAVALVVWADPSGPKDVTDWWIIDSTADAFAFSTFIQGRPRRIEGGITGIGAGIFAGIEHLGGNDIIGRRTVIDVSGDGRDNSVVRGAWSPASDTFALRRARAAAEERGITINGLAIINDVDDLDEWYDNHVRTGPQSFVMVAEDYTDFKEAMLAKLLREIDSGQAVTDLGAEGAPVVR